ncbi:TonB-dependent siderophore receptor [Pedobacter sp. HMF7647]|uniref:TonB-dependent siderophore receptor n=1 Tax=Hufsiella arboris TaxID=2695275 RepID=A0A7K1Y6B6_9SPHI|nr:TonB-dependent receptor [Hufsiella arboris]MXV49659.1 TonB-dependent siderophore receptor [Hufsiella arboris]
MNVPYPLRKSIYLTFAFCLSVITAFAQSGKIKGQVTTADGKAAPDVSVNLVGTKTGTTTEESGAYTLSGLKPGNYTIRVSALGLRSQEKQVSVTSNSTQTVNFSLTENSAELDEVVINGGRVNKFDKKSSDYVAKMPLSRIENPQVYTTVSKELLNDQLVYTVDDAMRNATGIQKMWEATGRGGDGGSFYSTRGFITQSSLRNGIAGLVTNQIDAVNLERLEVIKGPSATLFGSSLTSYGGMINRVTKKPYDTFGGQVEFSAGNFDFQRISVDLNQPISNDKKLLFRLNTAFNHEGTFQTVGFTDASTVAPSLVYKPTDRLSISLDAELTYGHNVGKQGIFFYYPVAQLGYSNAKDVPIDYRNSYMGDGLAQKSRSTNLFGQVNYKISETFTSSTNITASNSYSNGMSPYFYMVPGSSGKSDSIARADQSTDNSKNRIFEIQQNFNGDFKIASLRNRVVFGLDYLRVNSDQHFFGSYFDNVSFTTPNTDYSQFNGVNLEEKYSSGAVDFTYPIINEIITYSAFASDVLNLTEKLSVLAAIRYDHYDDKGGIVGSPYDGYTQSAWSPKFGIVYQPIKDQLSVFANYQNSFKNHGTFSAYSESATNNLISQHADLEHANQIEGGIKFDALKGKLSGTASYYNIKVENMLRSDPRALNAQIQDGTQISKGIEFELIANPARGLNIVGGFTYNDSKYEKADADVEGRRPATASSPYLANLWISYRLPETAIKGLGFGFGGNYASDNKIVNSITYGVFTLPSYTVLNASAFYDYKKFRLSAKVDNLTNEKYWIGYTTMNAQKLRSVVGSVAYKF